MLEYSSHYPGLRTTSLLFGNKSNAMGDTQRIFWFICSLPLLLNVEAKSHNNNIILHFQITE